MSVELLRRLFTVEEYERMVQADILAIAERVELLNGEIVEMSPIGTRHAACVNRLNKLFLVQVRENALVSVQNPIRLSDRSQAQPDLALLQPRSDFYATAHPQPQDILLIVEVADTSADYDRQVKIPLYAQAGIIEVWLVDLVEQFLEVYRQPSANSYQYQQLHRNQQIFIQALPNLTISIDDILG
ncbi:MAG: Uma2 family endonuclease [Gloeocapsa sp. UFS-A4-WI-NPMV-4B04]|jgi:Uma2 family endonuclease|nr:Uma2 family endonuclease [Gloeocapsa sp. UFS-A4-WI-NPMV-4B04]